MNVIGRVRGTFDLWHASVACYGQEADLCG